jgi:hypothetical protein
MVVIEIVDEDVTIQRRDQRLTLTISEAKELVFELGEMIGKQHGNERTRNCTTMS